MNLTKTIVQDLSHVRDCDWCGYPFDPGDTVYENSRGFFCSRACARSDEPADIDAERMNRADARTVPS